MSYILDALKKSEQERNEGSNDNVLPINGLYTPSVANRNEPARRFPWLFLSAVVFSVGIGSGAWFFYQATLQKPPVDSPPVEAVAVVAIENDKPLLLRGLTPVRNADSVTWQYRAIL